MAKKKIKLVEMATTPIPQKKDTTEIEAESQATPESAGETPATSEGASPFMASLADMVRAKEEKYAAQKAEREKLQGDVNAARNAQGSFISNYFKQQKPKYDENAEKRQLQAARIKAIGDALGLVASGFAAFGKNGAGYVPKFESSVVADIEKINEARKQYLQQNEEWKEFEYNQRLADLQAKTKAAEALLSAKDKDIENTREEIADYEQAMQRHQSNKEIAAIKAEQALEKQSQGHTQKMEQIGKRTEGAIAAAQIRASGKDKPENAAYFALWEALHPNETVTTESVDQYGQKKTTTKPKTYNDKERAEKASIVKESREGKLYDQYRAQGLDHNQAIAAVLRDKEVERVKNNLNVPHASEDDLQDIAENIVALVEDGDTESNARSIVMNNYDANR